MNKFVLRSVLALALAAPTAAYAQEAAAPAPAEAAPAQAEAVAAKRGQMLRDAEGRRVGRIDSIRTDVATVIHESKIYRIPLNTITVADRVATTSLTLAQIKAR